MVFAFRKKNGFGLGQERDSDRVYATWAEAQSHCGEGYRSKQLAKYSYQSAKQFFGCGSFPDVPWYMTCGFTAGLGLALARRPTVLRVLDFGGCAGNLAYLVAELFPEISLQWAVIEVEPIVALASADAQPSFLRFFTSIDDAREWLGDIDIVHSAGALQYLCDPRATVAKLIALRAPLFILQRCALTPEPTEFVVIQRSRLRDNGWLELPGGTENFDVAYPRTVLPKASLLSLVGASYRLMFSFLNEGETTMVGHRGALRDAFVWMR